MCLKIFLHDLGNSKYMPEQQLWSYLFIQPWVASSAVGSPSSLAIFQLSTINHPSSPGAGTSALLHLPSVTIRLWSASV